MCLGIPAQLVEMIEPGLAKAEVSGVRREVSTALVPEAAVGDWVLVHVGFALSKVDEDVAARTYQLLAEMKQLDELNDGETELEVPNTAGIRFFGAFVSLITARSVAGSVPTTVAG